MQKRVIAGLALVVGVWWMRRGDEAAAPPRAQAAVLDDGFAVLTSGQADRRVVELDRDGRRQHEMPLRLAEEVRLVGTRAGTAVGWQRGKQIELAILDSDGNLTERTTWGKKVQRLCDGAATNEHRFGVGWLESDGRVWFVHGPLGQAGGAWELEDDARGATAAGAGAALAKVTWCGIASAADNIALLWRDGSRLLMNLCSRKSCSGLVARIPIGDKDALLGYGCVRDSCLLAARDAQGAIRLHRVTERGRAISKLLEHAAPDTAVSIVGAGSRGFAIAYIARDGLATIQRVAAADGALTGAGQFEGEAEAPSLAWAGDQLLVAMQSGAVHVVAMPR